MRWGVSELSQPTRSSVGDGLSRVPDRSVLPGPGPDRDPRSRSRGGPSRSRNRRGRAVKLPDRTRRDLREGVSELSEPRRSSFDDGPSRAPDRSVLPGSCLDLDLRTRSRGGPDRSRNRRGRAVRKVGRRRRGPSRVPSELPRITQPFLTFCVGCRCTATIAEVCSQLCDSHVDAIGLWHEPPAKRIGKGNIGASFQLVQGRTFRSDNIRISCRPSPKPGNAGLEPDSQI